MYVWSHTKSNGYPNDFQPETRQNFFPCDSPTEGFNFHDQDGYEPSFAASRYNGPSQINCVTEVRKEKSRDAARSRRGKENHEFMNLSKLLPLPSAITSQLDKASIVRLCISSLKLRAFCMHGDPPWLKNPPKHLDSGSVPPHAYQSMKETVDLNFGAYVLQAHDGFVFAISGEGQILYISETVSVYLGLSQVELTGSSIFEYIHEEDRNELAHALCIPWDPTSIYNGLEVMVEQDVHDNSSQSDSSSLPIKIRATSGRVRPTSVSPTNISSKYSSLSIRFRSTLTKRGVQMKYSGFRVLSLQWWPRPGGLTVGCDELDSRAARRNLHGYVMCATALPSLNMNEMRVDKSCFTMKMSLDFKILSSDIRIEDLIQQSADKIVGVSFYEICYGVDAEICGSLHRDVLRKGQALSKYYRVIGRQGGFYWIQTCAHLMANSKTPNEHCIVAMHYVISNVQNQNEFYILAHPVISASQPRLKLKVEPDVALTGPEVASTMTSAQQLNQNSKLCSDVATVASKSAEKKRKHSRTKVASSSSKHAAGKRNSLANSNANGRNEAPKPDVFGADRSKMQHTGSYSKNIVM